MAESGQNLRAIPQQLDAFPRCLFMMSRRRGVIDSRAIQKRISRLPNAQPCAKAPVAGVCRRGLGEAVGFPEPFRPGGDGGVFEVDRAMPSVLDAPKQHADNDFGLPVVVR